MAYDFVGARTTIKAFLSELTDDDGQALLNTVLTSNPGTLSLRNGNTAIFGLGDSKKANKPIGERGSITTEGTLILLTPGERQESLDTLEEMITGVLSGLETDPHLGVPGLRVEHIDTNLILRRSMNITPKAVEPTLCAGAIIPLDVTVVNRRTT
jgi:hypothetical protein